MKSHEISPGSPGPIEGKGVDVGPTAVEPSGGGAVQRAKPRGLGGRFSVKTWDFFGDLMGFNGI